MSSRELATKQPLVCSTTRAPAGSLAAPAGVMRSIRPPDTRTSTGALSCVPPPAITTAGRTNAPDTAGSTGSRRGTVRIQASCPKRRNGVLFCIGGTDRDRMTDRLGDAQQPPNTRSITACPN